MMSSKKCAREVSVVVGLCVVLAAGAVNAQSVSTPGRTQVGREDQRQVKDLPSADGSPAVESAEVCVASSAALPYPEGPSNRYLSFSAGDPGRLQAIRVVFVDLPPPHDVLNGLAMWVGQPREISEFSGKDDDTPCPPESCALPTFTGAELQCDPFFTDWSMLGNVDAFDAAIAPSGRYAVQVVDQTCVLTDNASYSPPLPLITSRWADTVSQFVDGVWGPPDGVVTFLDLCAAENKNVNALHAPRKLRADINPDRTDLKITVVDKTRLLDAFGGAGFPFQAPPTPAGCGFVSFSCGDGIIDPGEDCDDGGTTPGDGCDASCRSELCGNGAIDVGEACDDGNTIDGDGCNAACQTEAICGDGVVALVEECDDGNDILGDGCSNQCRSEGAARISLVPVWNRPDGSLDAGVRVAGNEMILPSGGHRVFLELRVQDWDVAAEGRLLKFWQASIDPAGLKSGVTGTLTLAVESRQTDQDCVTAFGGACSFLGEACTLDSDCLFTQFGERCERCINCSGFQSQDICPGMTILDRSDYVFANQSVGIFEALDVQAHTEHFRFGARMVTGISGVADSGESKYLASFVLDVPADATGTFTIGFRQGAVETLAVDAEDVVIAFASMEAALITIGSPCCLPTGGCEGVSSAAACAGLGGTSVPSCLGDRDFNGVLDACECSASAVPVTDTVADLSGELVVSGKNRYLSFAPNEAGLLQAVEVTFIDLPPPFHVLNGQTRWVGEPRLVSELSGKDDGTPPTFAAASLGCEPVFADFGSLGTTHVWHEAIVPGGSYSLRVLGDLCDVNNAANLSAPLALSTTRWGDAVGPFDGDAGSWTAPDGNVSVAFDVVAILDKFSNRPSAPLKSRADIEPGVPDRKVNITDVTRGLDAFSGQAFPFAPNNVAPCP